MAAHRVDGPAGTRCAEAQLSFKKDLMTRREEGGYLIGSELLVSLGFPSAFKWHSCSSLRESPVTEQRQRSKRSEVGSGPQPTTEV